MVNIEEVQGTARKDKIQKTKEALEKISNLPEIVKRAQKDEYIVSENVKWFLQQLKNNELMAVGLLDEIEQMKAELEPARWAKAIELKLAVYKAIHGEKLNINVNQHITLVEEIERVFKPKSVIRDAEIVKE
jgi:hypothetical protein